MAIIPHHINQKGLSLIELIIVVAILGVLGAIAIPMYRDYVTTAKRSQATTALEQFPILLETYRAENGQFPPTGTYNYKEDKDGNVTEDKITDTEGNGGANLAAFTPRGATDLSGAVMFDFSLTIDATRTNATFSATGVREGNGINVSSSYQ